MAAERSYLRKRPSFRLISEQDGFRYLRWSIAASIALLALFPASLGWAQQDSTAEDVVSTQQQIYLPVIQSAAPAASLIHAAEEQDEPTPLCDLYPIALPAMALANLAPGEGADLR